MRSRRRVKLPDRVYLQAKATENTTNRGTWLPNRGESDDGIAKLLRSRHLVQGGDN